MKAANKGLSAEQKDAQPAPSSITKTQAQRLIAEHKAPQGQQGDRAEMQGQQDNRPQFQLPVIDPKYLTIDKNDQGTFNRDEFCTYYKGTYHPEGMSPIPVIIKSFKQGQELAYASQEDTTLRILATNANGYLPVYGKSNDGCVVMQAGFVSLRDVIFKKKPGAEDKEQEIELPRVIVARILYDVTKHLKEMNSPSPVPHTPCMHRDITFENVLLPANFQQQFAADYLTSSKPEDWPSLARIGDHGFTFFPVSTSFEDYFQGYPPELVFETPRRPDSYDEKLDVWRFAEFAFSLWTRTNPDMLGPHAWRTMFLQKSPPFDEGRYPMMKFNLWCAPPEKGGPPPALFKLVMQRCFQPDPKDRATMEEVFNIVQAWFKDEMTLEARKCISRFKQEGGKNINHLLEGYRHIFSMIDGNSVLPLNDNDKKFIGEALVELLHAANSKNVPNHVDYQLVLGTRNYPEILAKALEFLAPKKAEEVSKKTQEIPKNGQEGVSLSLDDSKKGSSHSLDPLDESEIPEDEPILVLLKSLLLSPSYALSYTIGLQHTISDFNDTAAINKNLANNAVLLNIFKNADEWKVLNEFIYEQMKLIGKSNLSQPAPAGILGLFNKLKPVPDEIKQANIIRAGLTALVQRKLFCETEIDPVQRNAHLKLLAKEIQTFGGNDLLKKIVQAKPTNELAALREAAEVLLQRSVQGQPKADKTAQQTHQMPATPQSHEPTPQSGANLGKQLSMFGDFKDASPESQGSQQRPADKTKTPVGKDKR